MLYEPHHRLLFVYLHYQRQKISVLVLSGLVPKFVTMYLYFTFLAAVIFVLLAGIIPDAKGYDYIFHNVLLNHFAYKQFDLRLPCTAFETDNKRSGHIVINLFCERRPFHLKITAPTASACRSGGSNPENFRLYINIRAHFLDGKEAVDLSDPLVSGKKRLTSATPVQTIEQSLQSFAQLLTTGSTAVLEYTPGENSQACQGKGGDSQFLAIEYVLVSDLIPEDIQSFRFTKCSALNGYIPTGALCDQYSDTRPLGCPVNLNKTDRHNLDFATGQDRRDLDCYQLTLGEYAKTIRELMDGSLVMVSSAHGPPVMFWKNAFASTIVFQMLFAALLL